MQHMNDLNGNLTISFLNGNVSNIRDQFKTF
jgi:hypothetical protein